MQACKICKGKFDCMFCGNKPKKKKKVLTKEELIKRDADRERVMLLDHTNRVSLRLTNAPVTSEVEAHREYLLDLLEENWDGVTPEALAKREDFTVAQMKKLLASALRQYILRLPSKPKDAPVQKKSKEEKEAEIEKIREKRKEYGQYRPKCKIEDVVSDE